MFRVVRSTFSEGMNLARHVEDHSIDVYIYFANDVT